MPEARRAALALLAQQPELTEAWLLLALAEQRLQRHDAMRAAANEAVRLQPDNVQAALKLIEALLLCGHGADARFRLAALEQMAQQDDDAPDGSGRPLHPGRGSPGPTALYAAGAGAGAG